MHQPLTLIVDDDDWKLKSLVATTSRCRPHDRIITATSVQAALPIVRKRGANISTGVYDFDLGKGRTGEELVRAHRKANRHAIIVCATAREGEAFDEAKAATEPAGANCALPFMDRNFPAEFREVLAA